MWRQTLYLIIRPFFFCFVVWWFYQLFQINQCPSLTLEVALTLSNSSDHIISRRGCGTISLTIWHVLPLFRVRSWHNGMCCMSYYVFFAIKWDTYIVSRNRFDTKEHECVKLTAKLRMNMMKNKGSITPRIYHLDLVNRAVFKLPYFKPRWLHCLSVLRRYNWYRVTMSFVSHLQLQFLPMTEYKME